MKICDSCPRACAVDRELGELGFCGVGYDYKISKIMLHFFEEPCISGERGSGAIFFSGCNLRCVFCQNKDISRVPSGKLYSDEELLSAMLSLEESGAHNINLVTPTPYSERLAITLERAKKRLTIPIVYNCGGYESLAALKRLSGLVDIYLPDFKYFSNELASEYSSAPNYAEHAIFALKEMYRQTGEYRESAEGIAERGVIVRHLVLPACRKDSMALLELLARELPVDKIKLSLMRQYTPDFALDAKQKDLHRRLTSFEYDAVLEHAISLGFDGFSQGRESAKSDYTPRFES